MTDTADKNPRNPRLKTICAICVPIHPHCARIKRRLPVIPLFLVSFSSLFPLFYVSFQIRPEAKGKLSVYEGAMSIYGGHENAQRLLQQKTKLCLRTPHNLKRNALLCTINKVGNGKFQQPAGAKERDKTRKEKLVGYFFNLSQLTFTALVLGGMVLFLQGNEIGFKLASMFVLGCVLASVLALIGNDLLKIMNAGIFVFAMLTTIALGIYLYLKTPSGKKWVKSL